MSRTPHTPHAPALRAPARRAAALVVLLVVGLLGLVAPAPASAHIEDYAPYQPATRCAPKAKPGTVMLGRFLVKRYGGGAGPISRTCGGSVSEHTEGRAFDWSLDATTRAGRRAAEQFLDRAFATDARGNEDALARRMGLMYVIWDDQIYASYRGFEPQPYLSSGCPSLRKCSKTLRHRDHVHLSLSRPGARGDTSWYEARARD